MRKIAALMLSEYKDPLAAKGVALSWTDAALDCLCDKVKSGKFGARDLRRVIRKEAEDQMANRIIQGHLPAAFRLDAEEGAIVLREE